MEHVSLFAFLEWTIVEYAEGARTINDYWAAVKRAILRIDALQVPGVSATGIQFEASAGANNNQWAMLHPMYAFEAEDGEYVGMEEVAVEFFELENDVILKTCVDAWTSNLGGLEQVFFAVESDPVFQEIKSQPCNRVSFQSNEV